MLVALPGGRPVPEIAQLVQTDEDTVPGVIHRLNEIGLTCLHPRWVGGRSRLLSIEDEVAEGVGELRVLLTSQLGRARHRFGFVGGVPQGCGVHEAVPARGVHRWRQGVSGT